MRITRSGEVRIQGSLISSGSEKGTQMLNANRRKVIDQYLGIETERTIKNLAEESPRTSIALGKFFIRYNSVATIAFKGFCKSIIELKREIGGCVSNLKIENPGSPWRLLRKNGIVRMICREVGESPRRIRGTAAGHEALTHQRITEMAWAAA